MKLIEISVNSYLLPFLDRFGREISIYDRIKYKHSYFGEVSRVDGYVQGYKESIFPRGKNSCKLRYLLISKNYYHYKDDKNLIKIFDSNNIEVQVDG